MARRNEKRKHTRYTKRLPIEFSAAGETYKSFSSDISRQGLFIRTNRAFETGCEISIRLHLPDGIISLLKGRIRRAVKTPLNVVKNGMGVELTEVDDSFRRFIKESFDDEVLIGGASGPSGAENVRAGTIEDDRRDEPEPVRSAADEAIIVRCTGCSARNKVRRSKLSLGPKCGKCGSTLLP